jgi:hypothetical protein
MLSQFHSKKYAFEDNTEFKNYLSAAAIIKNEAPYLQEWIEYHRILGIEKFYIYDDASTDESYNILMPYINNGIVICKKFKRGFAEGLTQLQRRIYSKIVKQCKNETRWLAIIDIDEFIVPIKHNSIPEFLKSYEEFSQILIHWKMFGSAGHKVKLKGLVIENYDKYQGTISLTGKSIVNPRAILGNAEIHYSKVIGMPVDERKILYPEDPCVVGATADIISVNHYWSKSQEEFFLRRPYADLKTLQEFDAKTTKNEDAIKRFIPEVKRRLNYMI